MPWVDELSELDVLRRCIRDLVALSTLPAIWRAYNPQQIADSVAAALESMLNAEIVYVFVPRLRDEATIEATRSKQVLSASSFSVFESVLERARSQHHGQAFLVPSPFGPGTLYVTTAPIGCGDGMVVAASLNFNFPSEIHRLLLSIAANDATIALQRWQSEAEQRRLFGLIERSSEFVGFAGLDGKPQYLNAAALELLGLSGLEEAQQFTIFDFFVSEMQTRAYRELLPEVVRTGRWLGELELRHFGTGETIPFLVDWFRIDDPQSGRHTNTAMVGRDLREQKKLEADLRSLNESLERRVVARTSELADVLDRLTVEASERVRANNKAQELQLELVHASRMSTAGQMAGALAHEVNQPLTACTNLVNAGRRMLGDRERHATASIRQVLDEAAEQALHAAEIIRRIRDFVTRGETEMHVESLPTLIKEASSLASVGTGTREQVKLKFDPCAEMALVNRVQFQQVIVNLIRNAQEAMVETGRHELEVATRRLDDGSIEVAVADHGSGLPDEIAIHLFEPFRTTKRNGMGLGLSICNSIVQAHGGKLRYRPNEGGGAVFCITLPATPDQ